MMDASRIAEMKENPKAPYYIVYEDKDVIVVYKKRDVFTIPTTDKKTFIYNLFYYLRLYAKKQKETVYLVHRLDYETSGLVIFAKTPLIQAKLKDAFEERKALRYYEAVVKETLPAGQRFDVDQYLEEKGYGVIVSDAVKGKEAITHIVAKNPIQIGTALQISIETGRKNQIRMAIHSVGLTLLGDKRYSQNDAKRMYLNAYKLAFPSEIGLAQNVFRVPPLWLLGENAD
jgi:23S rRNA pseudouridine1911/1915/1917 synthase